MAQEEVTVAPTRVEAGRAGNDRFVVEVNLTELADGCVGGE